MHSIPKSQFVVQSKDIVTILHALGWVDFRIERCRTPWGWKSQRFINGLRWTVARKIILLEAKINGYELHAGQLRDVCHLLGRGVKIGGNDGG